MSKINILYTDDSKFFTDELVVYIDKVNVGSIKKSNSNSFEVDNQEHEITITGALITDVSFQGGTVTPHNYIDKIINVTDDCYYLLKMPLWTKNKGKLIQVDKEKYERKKKSNKFWSSKLGTIIIIIICLLILLFLNI